VEEVKEVKEVEEVEEVETGLLPCNLALLGCVFGGVHQQS
jgi:hypothetical protein